MLRWFLRVSKTMTLTFPMKAAELLPHKPPMLLLDDCTAFDGETVEGRTVLSGNCALFETDEGRYGSWILLELMAQAVGLYAGLTKRQSGESPKIGFLLGTRKFEAAVAELTKGTEVTIRAKCVYFADKTLPSQFECTAMTGGKVIGTASLTVYEPEDLKAWTN